MSESERWAHELLTELRAGRFTRAAWRRFLARSFLRARQRRCERVREHRAVLLLAFGGASAWGGAALSGRPVLAAAGAGWWLLVMLMLDWHLGMLERPDGSPLPGFGVANLLTLARAGLPPALLALASTTPGLVLLALAGASDVLDGWVARRREETSVLGGWLDGTVDTILLGATAIGASLQGELSSWAAGLVLGRFGLPWVLVAGVYFRRAERPDLSRHVSGRPAGVVLFAGLALAFLGQPGADVLVTLGALGGLVAVAATVARSRSATLVATR